MSINSITDERLIRLYIRGEESSLNILINRYRTRISGFILSKVRNVDIAEDILSSSDTDLHASTFLHLFIH